MYSIQEPFKKNIIGGRGEEYLKIGTNGDIAGRKICSNGDVSTVYLLNVNILSIRIYLPYVPSPILTLAKATQVTSGM